MTLRGKAALVTGSSRGLGRAVAEALARAGASVAVHGRTASPQLLEAAQACQRLGARSLPVAFDATRGASAGQGIAWAAKQFGALDVFVHAVGANLDAPFLDLTEAQWDRAVELNLRSAFVCSQAAARAMLPRGDRGPGRVVLLASASGLAGRKGAANYTASKGGVVTLGRSMALELAPHVLVNVLAPGVFDTASVRELFDEAHLAEVRKAVPMGRLGKPEELAEAALFLCDEASYMTGQVLVVDGGRVMR